MNREELQNAYDMAQRGSDVDLQPIYAKIAVEKTRRAVRNKPGKVRAAAAHLPYERCFVKTNDCF